jgi:hypothetical protein
MRRPVRAALVAALVLVLAGALWWYTRPAAVAHTPPAGAPAAGSCFQAAQRDTGAALPWAGHPAVPCAGPHTVELFLLGQVGDDLIRAVRGSTGADRAAATLVMYGEARRRCLAGAPRFLGGTWHDARLTVLANWVRPATDGFFGCSVAQARGPGAGELVSRSGSLRGAMGGPDRAALAVGCVRQNGDSLEYVECRDLHDGEYVGGYQLTPPAAPFQARAVVSAAQAGCTAAALSYLGLPTDAKREDLRAGYVGPTTAQAWLGSDQTFACYAMAARPLRGSIRGLGQRPLPR